MSTRRFFHDKSSGVSRKQGRWNFAVLGLDLMPLSAVECAP